MALAPNRQNHKGREASNNTSLAIFLLPFLQAIGLSR